MLATAAQACGASAVYHRRQPERTVLYRVVQTHLATWLALHEDEQGGHAPALTEREFRRYLECGILAHGFARARCPDCGHDYLVAYSCKGRGICPSCTTRRMVETAAHLVDHVIPRLPVRQWVLSLPWRLRYHLDDAKLQNAVLHSFLRAIEQGLRQSLPETGGETRIGAVVFIHRFGGLLNAHLHFHVVVIDGVFCGEDAGHLHFEETHLTPEQVTRIGQTIRQRITRLFVRRGFLDKDEGEALRTAPHDGGFSLDANVRIEANDRQGLERLLRYCARPAFAQERLRQIDPEHLVYESKKPGPGGKVSVLLTPHQLLDRLAALIPPPRRHRHRYYGVLAPNSPHRAAVTSLAAAPQSVTDELNRKEGQPHQHAVSATSRSPLARGRGRGGGEGELGSEETPASQAARYVWAMLIARIYEVFPLICPKCGGTMRIIAFIDEGEAIREILTCLGEPVDPPRIAPARGPPLWEAAGQGGDADDLLAQPMPEIEFDQRVGW